MKKLRKEFILPEFYRNNKRQPDFNNFLKVMRCEKPDRPTLFEFFLNDRIYGKLTGINFNSITDSFERMKSIIMAFKNAGYDYTTIHGSDFKFYSNRHKAGGARTVSLNEGAVIYDRESYEKYPWPDPDKFDYSRLEKLAAFLPEGMKFLVMGHGGVLENVIELIGYESLCYMLYDDPCLAPQGLTIDNQTYST